MVRKLVGLAAGSTLVLGMFLETDAGSYVRTVFRQTRETIKSHVPIGFEIERARGLIDSLGGEIRRQMQVIAQEETGVERLAGQVAAMQGKLAGEEAAIRELRDELASGRDVFVFGGREFTPPQVKADLAARFVRFETGAATSKKLGEILAARRQGLEAARNRLAELHHAKRQLEVDVENLAARRKMLEVAQAQSKFAFDNSHLGRTRELIDQIGTRIKVAERLVDAEAFSTLEIPVNESAPDLMDRIAERFDLPPMPVEVAVAVKVVETSEATPATNESASQAVEETGIDSNGILQTKPVDNGGELQEWLIERFDRLFERVLDQAFDRQAAATSSDDQSAKGESTVAAHVPAVRLWTDDTGRYQTWGQLVTVSDDQVRILKTNGRHTTVPRHRLSASDRRYVQPAQPIGLVK